MKYAIRGFLLNTSGEGNIKIAFKGCICYKKSGASLKFVFPWNVTWLSDLKSTDFPIIFKGLKGKEIYHESDLDNHALVLSKDNHWESIPEVNRIDLNEVALQENLHAISSFIHIPTYSADQEQLQNIIDNTNIPYVRQDLSHLTSFSIPETVYIQSL